MKILFLGGARSGKSKLAEKTALQSDKKRIYVATGEALDGEMEARIHHHQQRRDDSWQTIEEPLYLANVLTQNDNAKRIVLLDCLTLWLSNCMHKGVLDEEMHNLFHVLPSLKSDVIFVSNEVGSGIVPLGNLSREFVDQAGWLNQKMAKHCDSVFLVAAGLPLQLKPSSL